MKKEVKEQEVINIEDYVKKAEVIETIEFDEKDTFDFVDFFETMTKVSNKNNSLKSQEADNLIKEYAPNYMDISYIDTIESKKQNIFNYLRYYDPNSDLVKNMSEHDFDKIYAISNYLVNLYISYLIFLCKLF